ncbi:MAG: hypothetical protein HQ492_01680 [Woeseiaceae bacterium]|nr:hypothetical protein [Woeseiaceae bacterium]
MIDHRVVLKAIGGLIVKIVASPFALLGKMLGVEASDLEYVAFPGGRSDLLPPEIQRAGKLAEALALRPELVLELPGVVDKDVDGLALKTARVDDVVEQRLGVSGSAEFGDAMYATRQKTVLEQLFTESDLTQDAAVALGSSSMNLLIPPNCVYSLSAHSGLTKKNSMYSPVSDLRIRVRRF